MNSLKHNFAFCNKKNSLNHVSLLNDKPDILTLPQLSDNIINFDNYKNDADSFPLVYSKLYGKNYNNLFFSNPDNKKILDFYFLSNQHQLIRNSNNSYLNHFLYKLLVLKKLQSIGLNLSCMKRMSTNAKIIINSKTFKPDLSNFSSCNKKYCPICSSKFIYENRTILENVLDYNKNNSNLFVSVTIPHYRGITLEQSYNLLSDSFKDLLSSNGFKNSIKKLVNKTNRSRRINRDNVTSIKDLIGLTSLYKQFDITFNNGSSSFNPHYHLILTCNKVLSDVQVKQFRKLLSNLWKKIIYKKINYIKNNNDKTLLSVFQQRFNVKDFDKHSIHVIDANKDRNKIIRYCTDNLALSSEVVNSGTKQTKASNNYNVNDLYRFIATDDYSKLPKPVIVAMLHQFDKAVRGKHLTKWHHKNNDITTLINFVKTDIEEKRKDYYIKQLEANKDHLDGLNDETYRQLNKPHKIALQCVKRVLLHLPITANYNNYNKNPVSIANTRFEANLKINSS